MRDRLIHQAVFRVLYHIFDRGFISDSYSCRFNKGTHAGVNELEDFARQISKNYYYNIYALKGDIRKFFASINKQILLGLIKKEISDLDALWLIKVIINSFQPEIGLGLPLGNVTSQLFANIYLNELDQFIKRRLEIKYYLRYCDDFVILSRRKDSLLNLIETIEEFLKLKLKLALHPDKISISKLNQGIDFLGYLALPHYRLVRTKTKKRIFRKFNRRCQDFQDGNISRQSLEQSRQSYLGILKHAKAYNLSQKLMKFNFDKKDSLD